MKKYLNNGNRGIAPCYCDFYTTYPGCQPAAWVLLCIAALFNVSRADSVLKIDAKLI